MKRRLLSIALIVLMIISVLSGCGKAGSSKVLKVGMECGYAPFNWTQKDASNGGVKIEDSSEYAGGYDVELQRKLQKVWEKNSLL